MAEQYGVLTNILGSLGLGELFSLDAQGRPTGWLADQIAQGVDTPEELYAAIENTDAFRKRYPVIVEQRQQAARGETVEVMTPDQVRRMEADFERRATYFQIPVGTYTSADWQKMISKGITPDTFEQAGLRSWQRITQAPPQVRQVFGEWFGPKGDAMLAAYFLDPEHITANIDRITSAAVAGGYARKYGFQLEQQKAMELADQTLSDQTLAQGFARIQERAAVFRETATEGTDLQAGKEGVDSTFGLDGSATTKIEKRIQARTAAFGGGGGAGTNGRGAVGLGAAE